MKTLYININNEQIQSNEDLEVLPHRLDIDLLYYLGEEIADGCRIKDETRLVTDFRTSGDGTEYKKIAEQLDELKEILFSSEYDGKYEFRLPQGYIDWLNYHPEYNSVYNKNFSHDGSNVISVDLEDLYENSVENLQRKILNKLRVDDFYKEVDEIVFNDDVVTRKSSIVCTIKDKYEGVGFKAYKKWLQDNEDRPHTTPKVCEKCGKNPCECEQYEDSLFPIEGITLGVTSINEVNKNKLKEHLNTVSYETAKGVMFVGLINGNNYFEVAVIDSKYEMPAKWKEQLGFDFGCKYDKCEKVLLNNGYAVKYKDEYFATFLSPNHLYLIGLELDGFRRKKVLNSITVILNKCPHCGSNDLEYTGDAPVCNNCGKTFDEDVVEDLTVEVRNEDVETSICPNCSSDDVEDDDSDYLQYTCNDCGHNWGHDDTVECPECGSDDVENDGTDNMQYKCNACGEIWGDCEEYEDNEEDEDELAYDHPLSLDDFFPAWSVTLNNTTVHEVEAQSYLYDKIDYDNDSVTVWVDGVQIRKEKGCNVFTNIYMTCFDDIYIEWIAYGFDWRLSYAEWVKLFKRMGFIVKQTETPRVESWEHGPDYLEAKFIARSADSSLKFELQFSYGREGSSQDSPSTLYSISVYSNRFRLGEGIHMQTFWNIDDLYRKDPIKIL